MKRTAALMFISMLLSVSGFAQSRVSAQEILKSIDEGKAVEYWGVEIVGDLNLTSIRDRVPEKGLWRFLSFANDYWYHVRVPLIFRDCIFEGDVIAYHHDGWRQETHNVVFHEDVSFEGCEFRKASAFKYARFHRGADFSETTYNREALFKYAEFSAEASFAGAIFSRNANFKYARFSTEVSFADSDFSSEADFKYTRFPAGADFRGVGFRKLANFKYTKFPRGVSFRNSVFQGDADFKYTRFSEPLDFEGTTFEDSADFKYTRLEGKSFVPYLLKNRK